MNGRLLVIGDTLLERDVETRVGPLAPDASVPVPMRTRRSRPGGAGLAAVLAARTGRPVTLLTALAPDPAGSRLARRLLAAGVDLIALELQGATPEHIRLSRSGKAPLRFDRGDRVGPVDGIAAAAILPAALKEADGVLVSDQGHGLLSDSQIRDMLAARDKAQPLVWDPHPRGLRPLAGAALATPNLAEAVACAGGKQPSLDDDGALAALASALAREWKVERVSITLGEDGALLAPDSRGHWRVRCAKASGESRGAGDMFAAEAAARLADGHSCKEAVTTAVAAATRFVIDGYTKEDRLRLLGNRVHDGDGSRIARPSPSLVEVLALAERVRRRGGAITATGGRFADLRPDQRHHLESAARLGDFLIVLLNSDRSLRALGEIIGPAASEGERMASLGALACVNAVATFDEPTPAEALRLLRPEVWAMAGGHAGNELMESREFSAWGGRVAILPGGEARSTAKQPEEVGAPVVR